MPKKITNKKPGVYLYSQTEPFELVNGLKLEYLDLAYETYGRLSTEKDNVILLHHSLSMSAHAANLENTSNDSFDYDYKEDAGWWDNMIGPDKPLDTNKFYIICINNLGSCFGTTGPANYKSDSKSKSNSNLQLAQKFPAITIHDMIISQKLLLDYLGIDKLKLVIGSSVGGMLSLAWIQMYPNTLEKLFVAACSHKAYSSNIFNRMIQQEIIALAKDKKTGLKLARMLGYYNYRTDEELNTRFTKISDKQNDLTDYSSNPVYKTSDLYSYFSYNADKFVNSFNTESYLCMLNAMDLFDLTSATDYHPAGYKSISNNCAESTEISIAGISSDILFPMWQQQEIYDLLSEAGYKPRFIEHQSEHGHDAFLVDYQEFGNYIKELLDR